MREDMEKAIREIDQFIQRPPSRPVKLMFAPSRADYDMLLEQMQERFLWKERLSAGTMFQSERWKEEHDRLWAAEKKSGPKSTAFQKELCHVLKEIILEFISQNQSSKLLIYGDEELYQMEFDPIHFFAAYLAEESLLLRNEIPVLWLSIGTRDSYDPNEIGYYRMEDIPGRTLQITQETFGANVWAAIPNEEDVT